MGSFTSFEAYLGGVGPLSLSHFSFLSPSFWDMIEI